MKDLSKETLSGLIDNEWNIDGKSDDIVASPDALAAISNDPALRHSYERYHLIRDVINKDYNAALSSDFSARVAAAVAKEPSIADLSATAEVSADSTRAGLPNNVTSLNAERAQRSKSADAGQQVEQTHQQTGKAAAVGARNSSANSSSFGWKTGAGGLAVAASVAMVSLIGFNMLEQGDSAQDDQSLVATSLVPNDVVASGGSDVQAVIDNQVSIEQVAAQQEALLPQGQSQQPALRVPGYGAQIEYVSNTSTYWVNPSKERSSVTEKRLNMFLSKHIENSPTADMGGMLPYSRLAGYDAVRGNADDGQ